MEFDIPIRVTAFLYDLEKKSGVIYVYGVIYGVIYVYGVRSCNHTMSGAQHHRAVFTVHRRFRRCRPCHKSRSGATAVLPG